MVQAGVKFVERLAIAALAVLDPLHQAPQQAFDGALIHGLIGGERVALTGCAGLPTCF